MSAVSFDLSVRALPESVLADIARATARRLPRAAPFQVRPGPDRWHVRLGVTESYDVWLLGWSPRSGIESHDHGDSAGAFVVLGGALVEERADGGAQVHPRGAVSSFAAGVRHSVRNRGPVLATSVHVYSPPLTEMRYFEEDGVRRELVDAELTRSP